ncbi:hypothetical protein DL95DRAFT_472680 [Leptodontidium sp. 2 PMI_412]|nr:hypothetical protein DL95DRAFT_472680 [Leptodontidium sp. 2 PMI_412]
MPIVTRDRRGKRARETSEDADDPEASLEKETGDADVSPTTTNQTLGRRSSSPLPSPNLSSSFREQMRTPPPQSMFSRVPNIKYFRDQEIFVENIAELRPQLSWDLIQGSTMKWLSYNDPEEEYNDDNPYTKFGIILVGEIGSFLSLKTAENHFSPEKPEFSIQLVVEDTTLNVLKDLLARCGEGYTVKSPLRIKVPESDLLSDSFNSGDPFPDGCDGTSTTDEDDGPTLAASAFGAGDKVAVQVWFGVYHFKDRSGPMFRLLKLWKLQPGLSGSPGQKRDPITPRKRRR